MHPAFPTRSSVISTILINAALLGLPLALAYHAPGRQTTWPTIRADQSPIGHDLETIYADEGDVDVLFVGSSYLFAGLLPDELQSKLSEHLGRPCKLRTLAIFGTGIDAQYYILRDFLSRHRAALVIMSDPTDRQKSYEPHMYMSRFLRYSDYSDALHGLSPVSRFQIFGEFVLGGPRKLLSRIRPDELRPEESTDAGYEESLKEYRYGSSDGFPYEEIPFKSRPAPFQSYFPASSPTVQYAGKPPGSYSSHFIDESVKLCRDHRAALAFIHMPHEDEAGSHVLPENFDFAAKLGPRTAILGVPFADLFGEIPTAELGRYMDRRSHLNLNGARIFTAAIAPQVIAAFDDLALPGLQTRGHRK